ncbi:MAG TPA: alpha/beta hydrolase [Microthrixaceae bacterium]|nr:alpha/beta hydrolase [Microthrixaceae bacterium]
MTITNITAKKPSDEAELVNVQKVSANGIEIAFETFGDPANPTILLVMGLGTQMIAWDDKMCATLAAEGYHVVRYDNRDVGLSTHIDAPAPSIKDLLVSRSPAYTISDMADDAASLLDAIGVESAHVVGASMGGFISQTIALEHSRRVRSLTLIMTSTGSKRVGRPTPAVIRRMATRPTTKTRQEVMDEAVASYRIIGSPALLNEPVLRDLAGRGFDRAHDPDGTQRQLGAIMAQPNRTRALESVRVPTLVIHGLSDPLVTVSGGLALAKAIPGAIFKGHHGVGHDIPRTMSVELTGDILGLVNQAR